MEMLAIGLWVMGALITVAWAYGIRNFVRNQQGVSQQTVNQTMLFAIALVIVLILNWSPFHLLWMFPAGFLLGAFSLFFPFSMLSIPGRVFGAMCCVGLTRASSLEKEG